MESIPHPEPTSHHPNRRPPGPHASLDTSRLALQLSPHLEELGVVEREQARARGAHVREVNVRELEARAV